MLRYVWRKRWRKTEIKCRRLSETNFVYTFAYREISCEIEISQSTNLHIGLDVFVGHQSAQSHTDRQRDRDHGMCKQQ